MSRGTPRLTLEQIDILRVISQENRYTGVTRRRMVDALLMKPSRISTVLYEMQHMGLVYCESRTRWYLTTEGEEALS